MEAIGNIGVISNHVDTGHSNSSSSSSRHQSRIASTAYLASRHDSSHSFETWEMHNGANNDLSPVSTNASLLFSILLQLFDTLAPIKQRVLLQLYQKALFTRNRKSLPLTPISYSVALITPYLASITCKTVGNLNYRYGLHSP